MLTVTIDNTATSDAAIDDCDDHGDNAMTIALQKDCEPYSNGGHNAMAIAL
jgi:hypothetical protein